MDTMADIDNSKAAEELSKAFNMKPYGISGNFYIMIPKDNPREKVFAGIRKGYAAVERYLPGEIKKSAKIAGQHLRGFEKDALREQNMNGLFNIFFQGGDEYVVLMDRRFRKGADEILRNAGYGVWGEQHDGTAIYRPASKSLL
jgi:hypothetical protein